MKPLKNRAINLQCKLSGEYRVQIFDVDGKCKTDTGFFTNILTDGFFDAYAGQPQNALASISLFFQCGVGTGTATPTASDTSIAQIGTRISGAVNPGVESARVITQTATFQWAASAIIGTITEVGIFNAGSGGTLVSRTRIKDISGTPTSLTLVAGDTLYITYKFSSTAPAADITGIRNIGDVDYYYTLRPSRFASSLNAYTPNHWAVLACGQANFGLNIASARATQSLGLYTSAPSGTAYDTNTPLLSNYVAGSFTRTLTYTFAVAQGNTGSGIGSIEFSAGSGGWQCSFAAVSDGSSIPKNATKTLTIPLILSFSR